MAREVSPDEAIALAGEVVAAVTHRTVWIGIDGFGAAGKSSLADRMAVEIPHLAVVHTDDFWGPDVREWDWHRFVEQVRSPLTCGRPAHYQAWNWDADAAGPWVEIAAGTPVIVEGVSSTRTEAGVPWDLTIWVDAPRELRQQRALERDGEAMLPRWLDDWMPSEQAYFADQSPLGRIDLLVSGEQ